MRIYLPCWALYESRQTCHQSYPLRVNFEAQSGENLHQCTLHTVLAKEVNFAAKVGHCTAAKWELDRCRVQWQVKEVSNVARSQRRLTSGLSILGASTHTRRFKAVSRPLPSVLVRTPAGYLQFPKTCGYLCSWSVDRMRVHIMFATNNLPDPVPSQRRASSERKWEVRDRNLCVFPFIHTRHRLPIWASPPEDC